MLQALHEPFQLLLKVPGPSLSGDVIATLALTLLKMAHVGPSSFLFRYVSLASNKH